MKRSKPPTPPPPLAVERTMLVRVVLPGDWSEAEAASAVQAAVDQLAETAFFPCQGLLTLTPATVTPAIG